MFEKEKKNPVLSFLGNFQTGTIKDSQSFKGSSSHGSLCGIISTLLFLLATLIYAIFVLKDISDRKEWNLTTESKEIVQLNNIINPAIPHSIQDIFE